MVENGCTSTYQGGTTATETSSPMIIALLADKFGWISPMRLISTVSDGDDIGRPPGSPLTRNSL